MHIKPRFLSAALIGATLLLGACKPETVTSADNDPDAAALNAAVPVELPPMVTQSRTYRCADASLVYVDFLSNNTALYRTEKGGAATTLTSPEAGKPYIAEGYSVSSDGPQVEIAAGGKAAQSCKA